MPETSASLLERLRMQPDAQAWQRLVDLYGPLLETWLRRYAVQAQDADDLVQDVMLTIVRELPEFHYDRQRGSFRTWLRTVMVNRLRAFWRGRQNRPIATGDSDFLQTLDQLESPESDLSRLWDREHDRHVATRLLATIEAEFEANTWLAFHSVTLGGKGARETAAELSLSVNAVFIAKSRVMRRLRQEMRGLSD